MFYKLGLLGESMRNSPSPVLHKAALEQLGLRGCYELVLWPKTRAQELPGLLRQLAEQGYCGLNVTLPYKTAVLPHLDGLSPLARQLQAVNTICVRRDGLLVGHNTDISGFTSSLQQAGIQVPERVVLLGAGGAARAVAFAVLRNGCKHLDVINRGLQRAQQLQQCLQQAFAQAHIQVWPMDDRPWQRVHKAGLIVNCTCVGAGQLAEQSPLPLQHPLLPSQVVCDIVYGKQPTVLLQQAARCGARVLNGNSMLLHQAAASFALWTNQQAPLAAMRQALCGEIACGRI